MTYIALLRGLNVGKTNRTKMADLSGVAEAIGWRAVRSYLQSGNLVFEAPAAREAAARAAIPPDATAPDPLTPDPAALEAALAAIGIVSDVVIVTGAQLAQARAALPYSAQDPKHIHLYFATCPLTLPQVADTGAARASDAACTRDGVVYLYTPEGMDRSKLARKLPRLLNAPATGRNLRTVDALIAMTGAI